MEYQSRMLCDVIPAAREVMHEWSEIYEFFGDALEITNSFYIATALFLERLRRNAFDLILTAFAFSSLGRSEIRATEQGFQRHNPINSSPLIVRFLQRLPSPFATS
jgi:hypothetical protein